MTQCVCRRIAHGSPHNWDSECLLWWSSCWICCAHTFGRLLLYLRLTRSVCLNVIYGDWRQPSSKHMVYVNCQAVRFSILANWKHVKCTLLMVSMAAPSMCHRTNLTVYSVIVGALELIGAAFHAVFEQFASRLQIFPHIWVFFEQKYRRILQIWGNLYIFRRFPVDKLTNPSRSACNMELYCGISFKSDNNWTEKPMGKNHNM